MKLCCSYLRLEVLHCAMDNGDNDLVLEGKISPLSVTFICGTLKRATFTLFLSSFIEQISYLGVTYFEMLMNCTVLISSFQTNVPVN